MPWYSNMIRTNRTWVYNNPMGVTTGTLRNVSYSEALDPFITVNSTNYGGIYGTGSISYVEDSPILFKSTKTYYFETSVINLTDYYNVAANPMWKILRMWVGNYTGPINKSDFWQGRTKVIDYVGFYGKSQSQIDSTYPIDTTSSLISSGGSSTVNNTNTINLQFFTRPKSNFVSEQVIEYPNEVVIAGGSLNALPTKYAICKYDSNRLFGDKGFDHGPNYPSESSFIKKVQTSEIDFIVQGWAVYKESNFGISGQTPGVIGWVYNGGTYSWRSWSIQNLTGVTYSSILNAMGPVTNEPTKAFNLYGDANIDIVVASPRWSANNFIGIELDAGQFFNLKFDLVFLAGISPINLYIGSELPTSYTSEPTRGLLIASFTQSNTYQFYNLNGGNYLYFVGSGFPNSSVISGVRADIGNISIVSGYSETDNNKLFDFQSTTLPYSEPTPLSIIGSDIDTTYETLSTTEFTVHKTNNGPVGSKKLSLPKLTNVPISTTIDLNTQIGITSSDNGLPIGIQPELKVYGFYSNIIGTVSNLIRINSKAGNGSFKAGVWENGVWNSGWRVDSGSYEFNDVFISFHLSTENSKWRVQIDGSSKSVSKFEIGDKVSIGNIVAITINDQRKILKNYFTIVDKNETSIIVEVENLFPIRRIEKDSPNHKILITKNVWLNGAFLNGYFEGVWNDGLFKGFPFITEMYNTHWIDGTFDGGHFYARKPSFIFQDTYYWDGFVGLTGATAHNLLIGDLITVDKFDKTVNPTYDGDYKITNVIDDYLVITDIPWGDNINNESGRVTRRTSTGLIQNFTFIDNNNSEFISADSKNLNELWRYGSWIDVNYSDDSTTNINSSRLYNNKSTTNFNDWIDKHQFGIGDSGVLNLYGNITEDVLSSDSYFKGLDLRSKKIYKLGTKFEIYHDYLGDVSNFNKPFNSNLDEGSLDNFYEDGWTFSFSGISSGTYSYLNILRKQGSTSSTSNITIVTNDSASYWRIINFDVFPTSSAVDDTFGTLISGTSSQKFQVFTTGSYDISVNLPSFFSTTVSTDGLEGSPDDDYLYLTDDVVVGRIRIVRERNNQQQIILEKVIKTTGSDFINIGKSSYPKGYDSAGPYTKSLNIEVNWKGELLMDDKVYIQFQSCDTRITKYNSAGPWRGSGFENGYPFYDKIIACSSVWYIKGNRTLIISNSGVGNSLGYGIKRTTNGTLLIEHSDETWHSITLNNNLIDIPKDRYSVIEFDLIQSPQSEYENSGEYYNFHFTDLYNFTTFINTDLSYSSEQAFPSAPLKNTINTKFVTGTQSGPNPGEIIFVTSDIIQNPLSKTALWSGIDYTKTKNTRKVEYFFNRTKLNLGLISEQSNSFRNQVHELDNIKFYEVDMIPFFKYTTKEYVDRSVKIPYQGNSKYIEFKDQSLSYLDSITSGYYNIQQTYGEYINFGIIPLIFGSASGVDISYDSAAMIAITSTF